jgi:hypothetical protein
MDTPSHARCHECVCSVRVRMPLYTPHAPSEGCGCQTCRPGHVARVPQPEAAIIASCRDAVFTIWVGLNAAHAATVLLVGKYTIRHSAVETRPRRSVHVSNIPALWNNEKVCACVRACVFVCVCVRVGNVALKRVQVITSMCTVLEYKTLYCLAQSPLKPQLYSNYGNKSNEWL